MVAVIGSGALWSFLTTRIAVDRDSRRHEALAADLDLYTSLTTVRAEASPASRESLALAAVVRARLRQRLVRAIMPSQTPVQVFALLSAIALALMGVFAAAQGLSSWYCFALLPLPVVLTVATAATEVWVSNSITQFLDGNPLRSWPWWVRAFAGQDVRVAYSYLAGVQAAPARDPGEGRSPGSTRRR
ncbi:hypothetical protein FB00_01315 [Cellulosimicrobium funkei]|uniref:Uncharacterized protein n=1 Tax=Cellulosimicrobium funkei TaxID=264251 RepID=A0A0H2KTT4_9MICO|nr:hypothetical protein [Cellulosimicrobium funkei]KLN36518.1 hypothetical protein FB00_01315 [Cellulosimicrobium funkei]